jgi:signal transduction histidine kinase
MFKRAWFGSLYSRIVFGFIALLAVLLLTQGLLFLWLTGRFESRPQGQTAQHLADFVARELSDALTAEPSLDLDKFIREDLSNIRRPFLIVMRDGRRASNRPNQLPPGFMDRSFGRGGPPPWMQGGPRPTPDDPRNPRPVPDQARPGDRSGTEQGRTGAVPGPGRSPSDPGMTPAPGRPRTDGPPPSAEGPGADGRRGRGGRGGGRGPGADSSPVVVNGQQVGTIAVPPNPPAWMALEQYGATLTWVGGALLFSGAMVASLLIFRPAHQRLRSLEGAARALAAGRTDVRADEQGHDEVSALAHEFNRMADDLDERATALAASDKARRQLLADVSHELMTPLTAIRGYIETLAMPNVPLDGDTRRRYLEIANRETYKLEAIIGDLLDLGRLEGQAERLQLASVSVEDLFHRVADRHHPVILEKNIELAIRVDDDAEEVIGDAARLEQALQNLAANAIRHIPDGGRLTLNASRDGDRVRILVQDNGPGIPAEHLPHIFDRFYKADGSRAGTTIPSGSGLGLSIVQTIVRRHGGEVRASNAPEGGAVFEMWLPANNDKSAAG